MNVPSQLNRPFDLLVIGSGAAGGAAAEVAGHSGDGLISVVPQATIVEHFVKGGGAGKPCYGQLHVCWARDEAEARRTAATWWPITGLPGALLPELSAPTHFEQAAKLVLEEDVAKTVVCGPDPERHMAAIRDFADVGFDHVYVHQIGPDQEGFFRFYAREVLPHFR